MTWVTLLVTCVTPAVTTMSFIVAILQTTRGVLDALDNTYIKQQHTTCDNTHAGHTSVHQITLQQVSGLWYILLMSMGITALICAMHVIKSHPKFHKRVGSMWRDGNASGNQSMHWRVINRIVGTNVHNSPNPSGPGTSAGSNFPGRGVSEGGNRGSWQGSSPGRSFQNSVVGWAKSLTMEKQAARNRASAVTEHSSVVASPKGARGEGGQVTSDKGVSDAKGGIVPGSAATLEGSGGGGHQGDSLHRQEQQTNIIHVEAE